MVGTCLEARGVGGPRGSGVVETDEKGRRPPPSLNFPGCRQRLLGFSWGFMAWRPVRLPKSFFVFTRNGMQCQGPRRSDFRYGRQ